MSRPTISVVMPFAGEEEEALEALAALGSLVPAPGDERILVDNSGTVPAGVAEQSAVRVVRASAERSPAHARNVGAEQASGEWLLFLDADCRPPADLLDRYFTRPVASRVGALAGEVRARPDAATVAGRYGARRSFLSQRAHLAHPYRPRAVAANLLVRREALAAVGGFYEGLRAAEDTDFSWRLQGAGWALELREEAAVEHRYRTGTGELRRQWRGYAAGRAWLGRRYEGFVPEPAARRALRRLARRRFGPGSASPGLGWSGDCARATGAEPPGLLERGGYLALDVVLSVEELAGLVLSNRPADQRPQGAVQAVLLAERFPVPDDPLVELARTFGSVRVEAGTRPARLDAAAARELPIAYREDDGLLTRAGALAGLVVRHPLRAVGDLARRSPGQPPLSEIAPAVARLRADRDARVLCLGGGAAPAVAARIARLAGRQLDEAPQGRRAGARSRARGG